VDHDEYLRLLDSVARYYNSQIIVHAGYLLTSVALIFAVFAIIRDSLQNAVQDSLMWIFKFVPPYVPFLITLLLFTILLTFFVVAPFQYPVCFKYFLGRTQLYICLSDVVWEHMGITGANKEYFNQMKDRVRRVKPSGDPIGIRLATLTAFEARLYISECVRRENEPLPNWREGFYLLNWEWICMEKQKYYTGQKIRLFKWLGYDKSALLFLAYSGSLKSYVQNYHKWVKDGQKNEPDMTEVTKGRLFEPFMR
jgi:hypothetical protein